MTLDDKETKILLTIHKEELNIIERKKNLVALKEILKDYKEKKDHYIKTDTFDKRKKIIQDLIKYNFKLTEIEDKDVDIDNDYICLFKGVHKRLLHLYVQNKSLEEIMKDKTIIKFVYKQFGHYKYYYNKVNKILSNKELFKNELNAIFKYAKDYIDEYNVRKKKLKECYKRKSTIIEHLSWTHDYIPDTKLENSYI